MAINVIDKIENDIKCPYKFHERDSSMIIAKIDSLFGKILKITSTKEVNKEKNKILDFSHLKICNFRISTD